MKKSVLILIGLFLFSVTYAQKLKVTSGSLSFMKEVKGFNLVFDYSDMAVGKFDKEQDYVDKKIEEGGFTRTMTEVIYPLLDKMAMMWLTGSIKSIHERFITNLIRRKCIAEIDKFDYSKDTTFLIYLPQ